jgi:hypothetical protein
VSEIGAAKLPTLGERDFTLIALMGTYEFLVVFKVEH